MTHHPFHRAAILGGGSAGAGLAHALDAAGIDTVVVEPDPFAAERAAHALNRAGAAGVCVTTAAEGVAPDLLVDAFEDPPEGTDAWAALIAAMPLDASIATTAPDRLARFADTVPGPQRLVALIVAPPAHLRGLVEIEPGPVTSAETIAAARTLAALMGKAAVLLPPGATPLADRLRARMSAAADRLLLRGATPWEVDEAMKAYGFDLGHFEAEDLIGLDLGHADRRRRGRRLPVTDRAVEEGRIGSKIGWGWYRYPGGGGAVIDPLVEDLAQEEARFLGVEPRDFTADDLVEGMVLAMLAEALQTHDEGIPGDAIDLVSTAGLGFPPSRCGIWSEAEARGVASIRAALRSLSAHDPVAWPCRD